MARKRRVDVVREGAKVYSYIRVSTVMQVDKFSLSAQRDAIKKEADHYDMTIVKEYADEGISGKDAEHRPGFMKMMDAIEKNKEGVTFVLVYKISRFGRNTAETLKYLKFMEDRGVYLISIGDGVDTSRDFGKFMLAFLAIFAEAERENILDQTMEGRRRKAREGKWNGGVCPYGYEVGEDDKLVVVESEARIARLIFEKFTSTPMEQTTLAKWLNDNGYKKELKRSLRHHEVEYFTPRFITRILRNPAYKGDVAYGKTTTAPQPDSPKHREKTSYEEYDLAIGAHEAIVSEEVWQKAQAKLDEKSGTQERREKDHEYILGSLLRCPKCGKTMYGRPASRSKKNANGEWYPTYYAYMCRGSLRSVLDEDKKCNFGQIAAHKIDAQVRDILMRLTNPETFGDVMTQLAKESVDTFEIELQIKALKKRLKDSESLKLKLEKDQMNIPIDENFEENYDRLTRQLNAIYTGIRETKVQLEDAEDKLDAIMQTVLTKEDIYRTLNTFSEIYDQMTDFEKKTFLRSFVKSVDIYPDKSRKHGCYVKSIDFLFPVSYHGKEVYKVNLSKPNAEGEVDMSVSAQFEPHTESIVTLIREKELD